MPDTGEVCGRTGFYEATCGHDHLFDVSQSFTTCHRCQRPTTWTWIGLDRPSSGLVSPPVAQGDSYYLSYTAIEVIDDPNRESHYGLRLQSEGVPTRTDIWWMTADEMRRIHDQISRMLNLPTHAQTEEFRQPESE